MSIEDYDDWKTRDIGLEQATDEPDEEPPPEGDVGKARVVKILRKHIYAATDRNVAAKVELAHHAVRLGDRVDGSPRASGALVRQGGELPMSYHRRVSDCELSELRRLARDAADPRTAPERRAVLQAEIAQWRKVLGDRPEVGDAIRHGEEEAQQEPRGLPPPVKRKVAPPSPRRVPCSVRERERIYAQAMARS